MERHPRLRRTNRNQLHLRAFDLEELVPNDHLARSVWAVVETLDLRALYDKVGSVEGGPGAPATDPAVLLALWLFATCEGVGSARELDRRCHRDAPYMWLCGGLTTNHTTLALFRERHPEYLDSLLASSVATLVAAGFVSLDTIAVDGRRIRANAGAASFRSREKLEALNKTAAEAVSALKARLNDQDSGDEAARRATAARRRADEERLQRSKLGSGRPKRRERARRRERRRPGQRSGPADDAHGAGRSDGPDSGRRGRCSGLLGEGSRKRRRTGLYDRRGRDHHEDGGWRLPAGLQLPDRRLGRPVGDLGRFSRVHRLGRRLA